MPKTIDLVVALSSVVRRASAAQALATRLGVETLLLFVRDPGLGTLIPAPGFPQTVRGGPAWRQFLAQCAKPGRHAGEVDLPLNVRRPALALAPDGIAAVLIGGKPIAKELEVLGALLPMLRDALHSELRTILAEAKAAEARSAAARSHVLATALESARAEASRLNAELQEQHRRKDDFLAMLAHELRNPLTPLVTSVELLRLGSLDAQGLRRQLDLMGRQLGQLSRLIEDLLDVSRVSHGRIDLRRTRLRLHDVLSDALEASRPLLDAQGHRVEFASGAEALCTNADAVRLTQVFANVLHNAAKYTNPGGHILISAVREGNEAVVTISDNGVGISAEMLPRVFDLFAQAPVSLSRAQGGLGIGLTLVRALVELHGGRVSVESAGIGKGTKVYIRLPLSSDAQPASAPAPGAEFVRDTRRSLRVLIVDDNQDAADALGMMLRLLGHHAEIAYRGLKALQVAPDMQADLLLIDIGLPDLDGYEVARRLRRVMHRSAYLVALTGYGSADDKRCSREAGFDEHLVKPVTVETLEQLTARITPLRDAASALAEPDAT